MDLLFAENNPAGVKAFLAEMGMIENVLRLPLVPLSSQLHQKSKGFWFRILCKHFQLMKIIASSLYILLSSCFSAVSIRPV